MCTETLQDLGMNGKGKRTQAGGVQEECGRVHLQKSHASCPYIRAREQGSVVREGQGEDGVGVRVRVGVRG